MNRICFIMNHNLLSVTFVQNLLDNFSTFFAFCHYHNVLNYCHLLFHRFNKGRKFKFFLFFFLSKVPFERPKKVVCVYVCTKKY